MSLIAWSNLFSVGVADIDEQHKQLVALANQLDDAIRAEQGPAAVGKVIVELQRYTQYHFAFEERLMARVEYPGAAEHRQQHADLIRAVDAFRDRFEQGDSGLSGELTHFLRDWLTRHIMNSDRALGLDLNARGIR